MKPAAPFVKSATTSTSVASSRAEIERMLRRYGADAFAVTQDYTTRRAEVSFVVADSREAGAAKVPVRIPVDVQRVYRALYGKPARYDERKLEQAERVAWRNLVLWIDSALSVASISLQSVTDTFFAHAVIGPEGQTARQWAATMVDGSRQLTAGAPAGIGS